MRGSVGGGRRLGPGRPPGCQLARPWSFTGGRRSWLVALSWGLPARARRCAGLVGGGRPASCLGVLEVRGYRSAVVAFSWCPCRSPARVCGPGCSVALLASARGCAFARPRRGVSVNVSGCSSAWFPWSRRVALSPGSLAWLPVHAGLIGGGRSLLAVCAGAAALRSGLVVLVGARCAGLLAWSCGLIVLELGAGARAWSPSWLPARAGAVDLRRGGRPGAGRGLFSSCLSPGEKRQARRLCPSRLFLIA